MSLRISVLITAYNCGDRVGRTLESVFSQTYPACEVIVVNDGSMDDTRQVLDSFGSKIRCIHQKNGGVAVARNSGIAIARGDWIALLDDDDIWMPDKLKEQAALIERHPEAGTVFSAYEQVLPDGRRIPFSQMHRYGASVLAGAPEVVPDIFFHFFMENFAKPSTLIFRADLLRRDLFKAERVPVEDRDALLRIAAKAPVLYCPKTLVDKHMLPGSMGEERLRVVDMRETVQKENRRNFDAMFSDARWRKLFWRAVMSTKRQRIHICRRHGQYLLMFLAGLDYLLYRFLGLDVWDLFVR